MDTSHSFEPPNQLTDIQGLPFTTFSELQRSLADRTAHIAMDRFKVALLANTSGDWRHVIWQYLPELAGIALAVLTWPSLSFVVIVLPLIAHISSVFSGASRAVWPAAFAFMAAIFGHGLLSWVGWAWVLGYGLASGRYEIFEMRFVHGLSNDEDAFLLAYGSSLITLVLKSGQRFHFVRSKGFSQTRGSDGDSERKAVEAEQYSAMSPLEIEHIINDYSALLEASTDYALGTSERFLPHHREKIEQAFQQALQITKDETAIDRLEAGYLFLAHFLPEPDGHIAMSLKGFYADLSTQSGDPATLTQFLDSNAGKEARRLQELLQARRLAIAEKINELRTRRERLS